MTNESYMFLLLTVIAACAALASMKDLQTLSPAPAAVIPEPAKIFRYVKFA